MGAKRLWLFAFCLWVALCLPVSASAADFTAVENVPDLDLDVAEPYDYVSEMIIMINEQRKPLGNDPLQVYWPMRELAEIRAQELAESYSSKRPDGTRVGETHNYREIRVKDAATVKAAFDLWMDTSSYKSMILDEAYVHAGIGYHQGEDGTDYWVILLSRKTPR